MNGHDSATVPTVLIVGGGHGAGKSTYCRAYVKKSGGLYLTNQEVRAAHGVHLERREVHRLLREHAMSCFKSGKTFIFEHVMSGHFVDVLLKAASEHAFRVELVYLDVGDVERSLARVDQRMDEGGHDVDRDQADRRLHQSRHQFWNRYRLQADGWILLDSRGQPPVEIASGERENIGAADHDSLLGFKQRLLSSGF